MFEVRFVCFYIRVCWKRDEGVFVLGKGERVSMRYRTVSSDGGRVRGFKISIVGVV